LLPRRTIKFENNLTDFAIRHKLVDSFTYLQWVFQKLMHNPAPEELKVLPPANWIKTRHAANRPIEIVTA
jgi:hypothetical protein